MAVSNNVTRLLDARKIEYWVYVLPAEKRSAVDTAALLGVSPDIVFKTIVLKPVDSARSILAVVPGPGEVNLKAAAKALGIKKVTLPTEREAESITGLQAGGISPLALVHKGFRVLLDECAGKLEYFHLSGGQRGLNIRLAVKDFVSLTNARLAAICRVQ